MSPTQLHGRALYDAQRAERADGVVLAPLVVAAPLRSPENIGNLFRVAASAGCAQLVLLDDGHLPLMKTIRKTSRGVEQTQAHSIVDERSFLRASDWIQPLIAVELTDESTSLFDTTLPRRCVFLVGNERFGTSPELLARCERSIYIPMFGGTLSMNVTHALAVVLFEWRRQHQV